MFATFNLAHSRAVKQNLSHGCVVHINAAIEKRVNADGTGIDHFVAGYTLSDWADGTTVDTVSK
jgi:hypothetical protein